MLFPSLPLGGATTPPCLFGVVTSSPSHLVRGAASSLLKVVLHRVCLPTPAEGRGEEEEDEGGWRGCDAIPLPVHWWWLSLSFFLRGMRAALCDMR